MNYKFEVKKKYPKANCFPGSKSFLTVILETDYFGSQILGKSICEEMAWENAYNNIVFETLTK